MAIYLEPDNMLQHMFNACTTLADDKEYGRTQRTSSKIEKKILIFHYIQNINDNLFYKVPNIRKNYYLYSGGFSSNWRPTTISDALMWNTFFNKRED